MTTTYDAMRQGCLTSTILTNHSKYVTIIANKHNGRKQNNYRFSTRGCRPMHKTTLTFEENPCFHDYKSSIKESYSGRKDLKNELPPPKFPSQHTVNFKIGTDHCRNVAENKISKFAILEKAVVHEDKDMWRNQMAGNNMLKSLNHDLYGNPFMQSSYQNVHDSLGKKRVSRLKPLALPPVERFNIITGHKDNVLKNQDNRKTSGNRVLSKLRDKTNENFLG